MRICHVITRMVAGGAQRNTLMCAENQAQRGHEVSLLSGVESSAEGCLLELARAAPFEFVEIPSLVREIRPLQDTLALAWLIRHIRRLRPQVLHTHTSKAGILGRLAGLACRVPVIVHTPHGHVFHSYFSERKAALFKLCERWLGRVTDMVIGLSHGCVRDHLQERIVPASKLVVIPSGVPLERFRALGPSGGEVPCVGYLGRLADIKGPLDLIEAFAILKQQNAEEACLLMVGDGPQRQAVEAAITRHGLQGCVELTGWQTDTAAHLARMDVMVVPSHNEGMGRVVVEAMAAGIPVVATAVGGLVDLVVPEYTGMLTAPRNPQALAGAIRSLLERPDRGRAWGENGRGFSQQFSDTVMFERLELLYQKLLRQAGA